MSKEALSKIGGNTPLLSSAWDELKNKPENANWLYVAPPLPVDGASRMAEEDEALFERHLPVVTGQG